MYNTNFPSRAELPTSAQLFRSTMIASAIALTALVTVVMPAEYAVDPTGVGGMLGLTSMGEIKTGLAAEARAAELESAKQSASVDGAQLTRIEQRIGSLEKSLKNFLEVNALATPSDETRQVAFEPEVAPVPLEEPQEPAVVAEEPAAVATDGVTTAAVSDGRSDEMKITLRPGEGAEVKLFMNGGDMAQYSWSADGKLNFEVHGEGSGQKTSYEKGRGVPEYEGTIEAAFDGQHGWFWRNRTETDVTMSLKTKGVYSEIVRLR